MAETDLKKVSILGKESIHAGFHLIPYIVRTVLNTLPASAYALVTDTNIAGLHLSAFEEEFKRAFESSGSKARFLTYIVPPGETSKSRDGKAEVEDFLLLNRCTRDTVILALGGGVIGDLVGFVAATLCVFLVTTAYDFFDGIVIACADVVSCKSQPLCLLWSTHLLVARLPSTPLMGRI